MGRPPLGERAMTAAERQKKSRLSRNDLLYTANLRTLVTKFGELGAIFEVVTSKQNVLIHHLDELLQELHKSEPVQSVPAVAPPPAMGPSAPGDWPPEGAPEIG